MVLGLLSQAAFQRRVIQAKAGNGRIVAEIIRLNSPAQLVGMVNDIFKDNARAWVGCSALHDSWECRSAKEAAVANRNVVNGNERMRLASLAWKRKEKGTTLSF